MNPSHESTVTSSERLFTAMAECYWGRGPNFYGESIRDYIIEEDDDPEQGEDTDPDTPLQWGGQTRAATGRGTLNVWRGSGGSDPAYSRSSPPPPLPTIGDGPGVRVIRHDLAADPERDRPPEDSNEG